MRAGAAGDDVTSLLQSVHFCRRRSNSYCLSGVSYWPSLLFLSVAGAAS